MKQDIKPDISPVRDRGESTALMEPLLIGEASQHRGTLTDLAVELAQKAAGFRRSLPESLSASLADLVRAMNCYYSNLIEGHDTVQKWIDGGGLKGRAVTTGGIREIHRRFGELLPEDLLWVEDLDAKERVRVVPGELCKRDVKVGTHVAVSPGALPRFLKRFEEVYSHLKRTDSILAAATAHHRLLWIHPFLDGNGRVARLMSHAMLLESLDTGGVWSVARGLARNVEAYKRHLADADGPRRNDLDGRGSLSEEALAEFARFFLSVCIDQVTFMEGLVQPERLRARIA